MLVVIDVCNYLGLFASISICDRKLIILAGTSENYVV